LLNALLSSSSGISSGALKPRMTVRGQSYSRDPVIVGLNWNKFEFKLCGKYFGDFLVN